MLALMVLVEYVQGAGVVEENVGVDDKGARAVVGVRRRGAIVGQAVLR